MNRALGSISSVLLAILCAACGDSPTGIPGGTGGGGGCAAGLSSCSAGCVDLMSDPMNCGTCNIMCPPGKSCLQGACVCTPPLQPCGAACVDVMSSAANCGICGQACGDGQVCSQGACSSTGCAQGLTQCGSSCIDLQTSPLNCGGCGKPCAGGQTCVAGVCTGGSSTTGGAGGGTGVGGTPTGGVGGATTGGVGGATTGGAGGATTGGAGGATTGGVGGATTGGGGGATTGGGGAGSGGTATGGGGQSTGGESTGGQGTGGNEPAPPEPSLVTSSNGSFWQVGEVTEASGNANVSVNDGQALGDWHGLGGTFNEIGWQQLMTLSEADRAKVMQLLFDETDGIGFAIGRIPIGASDYATVRYSLNETPNDTSMASFSIDQDRKLLIPYIKAAQAVKSDIWFWGSPWSPPTWMKNPSNADDGKACDSPFDSGVLKNDPNILGAHALYLAKFVQAYGEEGITISAVHPQNEPGYAQHYPSCSWASGSGYLMNEYIKDHLAPTFQSQGVTAEIWLGTLSNSTKDDALGQEVLNDSSARALISGVGLQWGMLDKLSSYTNKSIPVYQTEHKCGNYPWEGGYRQTAPNDYAYAKESWGLIRDWVRGGVTAYLAWNMVLDSVGLNMDQTRKWAQNALITVSGGKYTLTPAYYVFRHVGQYVEPGAKRVQISSNDGLAFKNPDGSIVAILYSQSGGQTTLSAGGRTVQFQIPADGWATVNLQAQ